MKSKGMPIAPLLCVVAALAVVNGAIAGLDFDAGAELRIRQELMKNVPGVPGGGLGTSAPRSDFANQMRFRPRVWAEVSGVTQSEAKWRIYTRIADEFRWCHEPYKNQQSFPGEVIFDNLFVEGAGLFDGFLDVRIGRQDLYNYCGLNHIFIDGTPGDGSRTLYSDMASFRLNFTEESTLNLFALYNADENDVRWGTDRSKHTSLTGFGGGAEPEMDDWGAGAIWGSKLAAWLPYQVFAIHKATHSFHRREIKYPWTQREMLGAKLVPQLDEEWSLQLEAMGQVGCNDESETLTGWSTYAAINWKSATTSSIKPFGMLGYHFMSGDKDTVEENGGNSAWDPFWYRVINDSEMFLYGSLYGLAWWSNMHMPKLTLGVSFGRSHAITAYMGPMFAAVDDGVGGGDGCFKGFISQAKYDFPIYLADKTKGERFEIVGHLLVEFFNPGDYYETDRPAYFCRWQIEVKF